MDWTSRDTVEVIYRLLAVKGVGTVQTNRILFSIQNKVGTVSELEMNIRMQLSEEQIQVLIQSLQTLWQELTI